MPHAFVTPIVVAMILGVQMHGGMVMFHYPRWSPDGRWLVLTTNVDGGADEEVWIVSKDGATRRRLTSNDAGDTAADWAPDGRSIIFERQTPAGVKSLVMDLDGANVRDYEPDSQRLKQLRLMAGDLSGRGTGDKRRSSGRTCATRMATGGLGTLAGVSSRRSRRMAGTSCSRNARIPIHPGVQHCPVGLEDERVEDRIPWDGPIVVP